MLTTHTQTSSSPFRLPTPATAHSQDIPQVHNGGAAPRPAGRAAQGAPRAQWRSCARVPAGRGPRGGCRQGVGARQAAGSWAWTSQRSACCQPKLSARPGGWLLDIAPGALGSCTLCMCYSRHGAAWRRGATACSARSAPRQRCGGVHAAESTKQAWGTAAGRAPSEGGKQQPAVLKQGGRQTLRGALEVAGSRVHAGGSGARRLGHTHGGARRVVRPVVLLLVAQDHEVAPGVGLAHWGGGGRGRGSVCTLKGAHVLLA